MGLVVLCNGRARPHLRSAAAEHEAPVSGMDAVEAAAFERFKAASQGCNLVPLFQRILSDHLTPVLAYRCLVSEDERTAPSFLFESVINGSQQVRLKPSNA